MAKYRQKRSQEPDCHGTVYFSDMSLVRPDGRYFAEADRDELGHSRMLCVPFGEFRRPGEEHTDVPNFLLNLTLPPKVPSGEYAYVPTDILRAVSSKLLSGVSALLDRRMKRITEAMTAIHLAHLNADTDLAVRQALRAVLPHFVLCEGVMWVVPLGEGYVLRVSDWPHSGDRASHPEIANVLGAAAEMAFAARPEGAGSADRGRVDTALILGRDLDRLNSELNRRAVPSIRSLLIGRVHNRNEPGRPRGYVVLANRISDLADLEDPGRQVPDWFDWEDELYLNHICAILDLIAELFTAEESRFNRAQILHHEMQAPTTFVYATAERLLEAESGKRVLASGMRRRELSDIMEMTRLQSELVNGWMLGLKSSGTAPADHYFPQRTDLNEIADATSRLMIPYCRRFDVSRENIRLIGRFPVLHIDAKAVTQVFMNLMGNSINYAFKARDRGFELRVSVEDVTLDELRATTMDEHVLDRLYSLGIRGGWLFYFSDQGIGVSPAYRDRIFSAGVRDTTSEQVLSRLGAGLGLSVVRGIMRDHFGEAWLENLSRPTLFHLFFPDILKRDSYEELNEWKTGRDI